MIIPLFVFFSRLDLTSTYISAVLVYAGLITPFAVYLLTNFFRTIPHEIVESALMDGATSLGILAKILVPLSAPALVTLIVVNSLWVWSDLLIALVLLPSDSKRTLMVGTACHATTPMCRSLRDDHGQPHAAALYLRAAMLHRLVAGAEG
jgi:ABC-type glycerol-3-phosphate transport system permease component